MKEYDEEEYGIMYHVIEYNMEDLNYGNVISELFKSIAIYEHLKVIDHTIQSESKSNYYHNGSKHNKYGPAVVSNLRKEYFIDDEKIKEDEFKNWKRTSLIDKMLGDDIHE